MPFPAPSALAQRLPSSNPFLIISLFRFPKRFSHFEFTLSFLSQVRTSKLQLHLPGPAEAPLPDRKSHGLHTPRSIKPVRTRVALHGGFSIAACLSNSGASFFYFLRLSTPSSRFFSPESSSCWPRNSSNNNRSIICISERSEQAPLDTRKVSILTTQREHSLHPSIFIDLQSHYCFIDVADLNTPTIINADTVLQPYDIGGVSIQS